MIHRRTQHALVLAVALLSPVAEVVGQAVADEQTMRGVVWNPPRTVNRAVGDLVAMAAIGVEAVRTPAVSNEELLVLTDSLGLTVFQDSGLRYMPGRRLIEQQTDLERELAAIVERSAGHPSAVYFGLGEGLDTSDPRTCSVLGRLTEIVHRRLPLARTYYVGHFLEDDRCAGAVDFRLADTYLSARIVARLAAGEDVTEFDGVGVGALGSARKPGAGVGLSRAGSIESQARFLEDALGVLLHETRSRRPATFVYRWRDQNRGDVLSFAPDRYGLMDSAGVAYPAFDVVKGFYGDTQRAFAFPFGEPADPPTTWLVLLCWLLIGAIGSTYAVSPTFRQVALRYFRAHGFFREAVLEGRDVLPMVNVVLLVVASGMAGVIGTAMLLAVYSTHTASVIAAWVPRSTMSFVSVLVATPWLMIVFVGCVHALWHTIWTSALSIGSRAGKVLLPAQTLMLVVWPLWPLLAWGAIASILPTLGIDESNDLVTAIIVGLTITYAAAAIRTTIDYQSISRVPWIVAGTLAALSPVGMLLLLRIGLSFSHGPEMTYLWHMLWRQ